MDITNSFGMKRDLGATPVITMCPSCKTTVETIVESQHRPVIIRKWCCSDVCCIPFHRLRSMNNQDNQLRSPDLDRQHTHKCPRCAYDFNSD